MLAFTFIVYILIVNIFSSVEKNTFNSKSKATDIIQEIGPSGKPKIFGEEFKELKKLLREKTKKMREQPTFRLRELGDNASLSTEIDSRIPLFLSDIQHLIMYSQIGVHSPYTPARWCQLDKYSKLTHTNVLIIENISCYNFISNENVFSFLSSKYKIKLELVNPEAYKSDVVQDISMVPITATQMRKYISQFGSLEEAVDKSDEVFDLMKTIFPYDNSNNESIKYQHKSLPPNDKFPRTQLLLSGWQMVEENYPLPIKGLMERKYPGYVLTKDTYKDVTPFSPMFGIDCEMCKTDIGDLELTRVSVVDENLQVVYETFVKPYNKIVDYLTKYSGITKKSLVDVKKRLEDVQEDLRQLLPEDAIIVGQSVGNDLHALKMMHPYVIDTSVIYNITGNRNKKTKLQTLTRYFLNERIQEGHGHCSVEDSIASLKLTQCKLANNLYFGDLVMSGIQEQLKKHVELGNPNFATSMLRHTTRMEKTAQVISTEDLSKKYEFFTYKNKKSCIPEKINYVSENSHDNIIRRLCNTSMQYTLNIAHIKITASQYEEDEVGIFKTVDSWVRQVYENTAMPGLSIVIFSGQGSSSGCCFIDVKRL